jgi:hypothetical protein
MLLCDEDGNAVMLNLQDTGRGPVKDMVLVLLPVQKHVFKRNMKAHHVTAVKSSLAGYDCAQLSLTEMGGAQRIVDEREKILVLVVTGATSTATTGQITVEDVSIKQPDDIEGFTIKQLTPNKISLRA